MNLKVLNELDRILKHNPELYTNNQSLIQVINGAFNISLTSIDSNNITEIADVVDDAVLEQYFSRVWQSETKKFKYSGLSIIDEVNAMRPREVIDIGCGYNEFKGKIDNLTGIDPYNNRADIKTSVIDYKTDTKYDVAICLGSINFGSTDKIIEELTAVVNLTSPSGLIYFRVNPGRQHDAPESKWINFYDWDPVFISNIARYLDCRLVTLRQDTGDRFYFVLKKKNR
jgi:hypothetical protein